MLNVKSISRHYGEMKAVDDVSFSIEKGEIVGLLGHNGAGKTTIMKMLSGYLEPDTGSIEFQGVQVSTDPAALQSQLGYLPENPPVYPELSVAGYLDYAAELKGLTGEQKRKAIRHVVEATELETKLLSPIATLSRGMKQRVGVAQAIIGSPSLLILDEPTNGLDPTQTEQMRQVIRNISETATVILSTHIMQEVEALCDRAIIIRQGKLAVDARLKDLTQSHGVLLRSPDTREAIETALRSFDWFRGISVTATSAKADEHNGISEFAMQLDDSADLYECLSASTKCLVENGIAVMGLHAQPQDLQSLFVQVNTHTEAATDTTPEASPESAHDTAGVSTNNDKEVEHVA